MCTSRCLILVGMLAGAALLGAQDTAGPRQVERDTAAGATAQKERPAAERRDVGSLAGALDRLREHPLMPQVPQRRDVTSGDLLIGPGEQRTGPVVVFKGTLTVRGRLDGSAMAIGGDVVVDSGGQITGDAAAVEGEVRVQAGGVVGGETRVLSGVLTADRSAPASATRALSPTSRIGLALSWMAVLLVIGIGVLVFAQPYLEGVVETLETRFWRSFVVGILSELAAIPVLLLLLVALAVTVIGILLIPFAVVAYILALAGLVTLGFVAVARLTGGVVGSDAVRRLSARGSALRGVVVGTVLLLGVWVIAAAVAAVPLLGPVVRVVAATLTFVAVTAGLGATVLSRAGSRASVEATAAQPVDPAVWQTPTPVTGVAAARRPGAARPRERV